MKLLTSAVALAAEDEPDVPSCRGVTNLVSVLKSYHFAALVPFILLWVIFTFYENCFVSLRYVRTEKLQIFSIYLSECF